MAVAPGMTLAGGFAGARGSRAHWAGESALDEQCGIMDQITSRSSASGSARPMLVCRRAIKRPITRSGPKKPATAPTRMATIKLPLKKVAATIAAIGRSIFAAV